MGRLIDADVLIKKLRRTSVFECVRNAADKNVFEIIEEQPTAYDVEKVVAELEKLKQLNKELSENAYLEDDKSFYFCAYTNFARSIGIVRKGGIE